MNQSFLWNGNLFEIQKDLFVDTNKRSRVYFDQLFQIEWYRDRPQIIIRPLRSLQGYEVYQRHILWPLQYGKQAIEAGPR